ncbi:MAG: hypothetical protein DVB31_12090 [Verrucomicrobia bacterium]|nr:MAG: hypothetical protein DVB31_12090 [Verrucomicrobiota bacterium]
MSAYDPILIQRAADRLHTQAAAAAAMSAAVGVLIGYVVAPHLLQALPPSIALKCPEWLVPVAFGVLGWLQGLERGAQLRLQSQSALCQMRIEQNTRPLS